MALTTNTHARKAADEAEREPHLLAVERASSAGKRAGEARRRAQAAQRSAAGSIDSAAESLARTADSQDRVASTFDDAAEHLGRRREDYRARAARHRKFAREDRRMAQQLRKISGDPNWARDAQRRCKQRFFYALRKNHEMRFLLEQTENRMESTAEERRRALLLGAELQPMSTVKITLEKVRLNNPWPSGNS